MDIQSALDTIITNGGNWGTFLLVVWFLRNCEIDIRYRPGKNQSGSTF